MENRITHKIERKAFEVGLDKIISKAQKGEDVAEAFQSVIGMMEKILGDSWEASSYEMLRALTCQPDSKWARYTHRLLREVDPKILKTLVLNAGYEAGFRGYKTSLKMSEQYHPSSDFNTTLFRARN